MCGIVAYLGKKQAYPIIIKGLQRLEYRGYDSAGVALMQHGKIVVHKCKGKVAQLMEQMHGQDTVATVGMGHTRWATHGEPNDVNAHPHFSNSGRLAIIHNGILENYATLKTALLQEGYTFQSQTDTEVLVNFIESVQKKYQIDDLVQVLEIALPKVVGAYALVLLDTAHPSRIIAARKSSPMIVGVGEGEYIIASDATPIIEHTRNVIYLNDNEIITLDAQKGIAIQNLHSVPQSLNIQELDLTLEKIEKGGFEHFMLKEIFEQPKSIVDSLRGRLNAKTQTITLGGIRDYESQILRAPKITMIACGTAYLAALVGKYLIEDLARIPVEVEFSSEFRYRHPIIHTGDVVLAVSQSGETADTLAAIELAKSQGATVLGLCNVVGSSIARNTHAGIYTHAGPEIGVASTKAFTAQVSVLVLFALRFAHIKQTISADYYAQLIQQLDQLPDLIEKILATSDAITKIAAKFQNASSMLYLGRGFCYPVALEGALKLKEISYIHAEGYPAAEIKHGPIALIDENMPVVMIALQGNYHEKMLSNVQEVKARKGKVIALVSASDQQIRKIADEVIEIPLITDALSPLLAVIPLQLLAYHMAVLKGCDVDQPRNLAKSVTVE